MTNRMRNVSILIFGILVAGIFGVIMFHQLKHGDFPGYISYAREFSETGYLYKVPHTLLERLIVIIRALLPANILVWISPLAKQVYDIKAFEISTLILMVLVYCSVAFIILRSLLTRWKITEKPVLWFALAITLIIMTIGPIFIFTYPQRMFVGYISPNRYDSPTYILFKPFVILMFWGIIDNLFEKWDWKKSILMCLAVVCATLSKPNFTLTIIPAVGLLLLFYLKKLKKVNWLYLIFAIGVPAFVVLLGQFVINYTGDRGDRLVLDPFRSILHYVPNLYVEAAFILLSILFPLMVTIMNWKDVKGRVDFRLAWINFAIALVIGLVLTEEINATNNNSWNSPMIAVFLLFLVTIIYYAEGVVTHYRANKKWLMKREILPAVVLVLHFVCGVIYYVATLLNTGIIVN